MCPRLRQCDIQFLSNATFSSQGIEASIMTPLLGFLLLDTHNIVLICDRASQKKLHWPKQNAVRLFRVSPKSRSSRFIPKPRFEKATKDAVPNVRTPDLQMPPFGPELHAQKANGNDMISIFPAPKSAFTIARHPDQTQQISEVPFQNLSKSNNSPNQAQ